MFRRAARLVVIDPTDRAVLLFQYEDGERTWWATPGGGLDGEEDFEDAARREAAEELGVHAPVLEALWERTVQFSFRGVAIHQLERYFLILLPRDQVRFDGERQNVHTAEGIRAQRWWSSDDIKATSEPLFPEDLRHRLREFFPAP